MKRTLQFAVAKYTPDLHRMEPRNVGVVLWSDNGTTLARFAGESDEGFRVPAIVSRSDRHAFREWITYWRYQLNAPGVSRRSGEFVERSSPKFLDALREKSKEQFRLVDGGVFTKAIAEREFSDVLDELFQRLVERPPAEQARAELMDLIDTCKRLLSAVGLAKREDVRRDLPVPRKVHGVLRTFSADYAIGPIGQPTGILQRVLLTRNQSIDSNAFMFDTLLRDDSRPIRRENCAALINGSHAHTEESRAGLAMLKNIVPVIDVSKDFAIKEIEAIAERTKTSPN